MFRIPVKISSTEVIKLNARLTNNVRQLATPSTGGSAPPPPPPPNEEQPRKRGGLGGKLFLATLGATAITGATLAYAKSDNDFRKILKEYVPWTDDAIALMYSEREMSGSWMVSQAKGLATSVSDLIFGDGTPVVQPATQDKKFDLLAPIAQPKIREISFPTEETAAGNKDDKLEEPVDAQPKICEISFPNEETAPGNKDDKIEEPVKVSNVENIQNSLICPPPEPPKSEPRDYAKMLDAASAEANSAYKDAINILNEYVIKVNAVMESCAEGGTGKGPWEELRRASKRKIEAECRVKAAIKKLDTCSGIKAERARADLSSQRQEYERVKAAADVAARYWPQVEEARRHFIDELEALFPRADISAAKLDTRGGDTDALLLVTLRKVLLYQQLLAKMECELTEKVNNALKGSDEDIFKAKIEIELERERRELALLFQKKTAVAKAAADKDLAMQLKRQMELFQLQLQDTLDHRTAQVQREEKKNCEEKLAAEKAATGVRLAAVLGRLQGVDHALKARSDADKMARQAQLLWSASEALEGMLRGRGTKAVRVSVAKELEAIAAAAADTDELVAAVLRGVPAAARERGVLSEVSLRERFLKVEKVCRSVSLVPACGARLHIFMLSWLQGVLLVRPPPPPRGELKDEPTDFSKLDNYDILERARYCVERSQWGQALRYIQLLKGAPATVARDWANEMALHLEARQAASALLAHASASGLLYL